jgi:2-oxo-3-hexenedioate decarboxylase
MDAAGIAREILAALDEGRQIPLVTDRNPDLSPETANAVTAELRRLRIARGETPVGRKIGFTNRGIWDEYQVHQPIWGDMYDRTVHDVGGRETIRVSQLPEPRIEPEIVLGLRRPPASGSLEEIAGAIEWVAHGFEFVQSLYPGWRFRAADCIADGGLHGALFIGPRKSVAEAERATLAADLAALEIELFRDGERMDSGVGANALDGPLSALSHLVDTLAADPLNPPFGAGEIVTTGTLTRAFPVQPGEAWETRIAGYDLPGLEVRIA